VPGALPEQKSKRAKPAKKVIRNMVHKIKSGNRKATVVAVVVVVLVVILGVFLILQHINRPRSAEAAMEKLAKKYYKEKIVDSPKKSSSYTIVVKNIKALGYDTSEVEKYGCSATSYAIIYIDASTGKVGDIVKNMDGC
jgi:hypothetical protein